MSDALFTPDSVVLHNTRPRFGLAYRFINFMLGGKPTSSPSTPTCFDNPNRDTMYFIDSSWQEMGCRIILRSPNY